MMVEERLRLAVHFKPEIASLNIGTMNAALFPMLSRYAEFPHDWERPYLEASRAGFFRNTFAEIELIVSTSSKDGTRFEFECYDTAHLYTVAHFVDRGLVKPPFLVQPVFGILGGIGTHP